MSSLYKYLIFLFFNFSFSLYAQDYSYKKVDFKEYLSDRLIVDYFLDKENFLWAFNKDALIKYDGKNVLKFKVVAGKNQIVKAGFDNKSLLFYLLDNGDVCTFNITTYTVKKLQYKNIEDFKISNEKIYLLDNNFKLSIFNLNSHNKQNEYSELKNRFSISDKYKEGRIFVSRYGIFISIYRKGVYLISNSNYYKVLTEIDTPVKNRIVDFNNELIITDMQFFLTYNPQKKLFIEDRNRKIEKGFTDINFSNGIVSYISLYDKQKFYIVSSNKVLFELSSAEKESYFTDFKKFKDIYVLNSRQGLFFVYPKRNLFNSYYKKELESQVVKRKIIERNNELLFCGYPHLISIDYLGKTRKISFPRNYFVAIYDMVETPKGFFAATDGSGIQNFNKKYNKKYNINFNTSINKLLTKQNVFSIYYDEREDLIYSGDDSRIYFFRSNNINKIYRFAHPFLGFSVRDIKKIKDKDVFIIATENGTFLYNTKSKTIKVLLKGHKTTDIFIDYEQNKIWIGYERGIFIYDLKSFSKLKTHEFNKLRTPIVTSILEDNYGKIWISTFSGVVKIDKDLKNETIFTEKNGLTNEEFNYKSSIKLRNGKIIFGGISGYDIIDPSKANFEKIKINVADYSLIGRDTIINKYKNQEISYNAEKYICKINFSANQLLDNLSDFQYKINNENKNWIDVDDSNRNIKLVGLAAGKYTLKFRATDENGNKIESKPIVVNVKVSFYNSLLFKAIVLLFFSVLLLSLVFSLYKSKVIKRETIEEISMDLHDEVGTILTKTKLMLETEENSNQKVMKDVSVNIDQINYKFREFINTTKNSKRSIFELYDDCNEVLSFMTRTKNLDFKTDILIEKDFQIDSLLYKDIKFSVYEIINNIIKYSKTSYVKFSISYNKGIDVIITTEEEHAFYEDQQKGNGLRNISKRCMRHKGFFEINNIDKELIFKLNFK